MNKRGIISKKGLSTIIVTLIIILISLVAIGIFWVVINNLIQGSSENIGLGKLTFSADISQVHLDNSSNNVSFTITRNVGAGDIVGMKFVFENSTGQEVVTENFEITELSSRKFLIHLGMDISTLKKISVVPLFKASRGEYTLGNIVATYNLKGTESKVYICGNGIAEPGEFCDGTNLDGATCQSLGFTSGPGVTCTSTCFYNTSQCSNEPEAPPVNITPLLWYKFDGNILDSSGVSPALDGSWVNGTGSFVTGVNGQALNLAGIHAVQRTTNTRLGNLNALTISVSAKRNVASQGGDLIYKHTQYYINSGDNLVTGRIYIGGNSVEVSGTTNINDLNWHSYSLTYDGQFLKLFVDGIQISSTSATGVIDDSIWQDFLVGHCPLAWGGCSIFNGQIDELKIYNVSVTPPECSPGNTKLCDKQLGVCSGSTQTCNSNSHWPGCTTSTYLSHNSRYLAIEGPIGNPSCSDGYDNDCDGNIDGTDSGCMNLYTINTRTGEETLFDGAAILKFYSVSGGAVWSNLYDWDFDDGISNTVGDLTDTGAIGMVHYYTSSGVKDVTLNVHQGVYGAEWTGYGSSLGEYHITVNVQGNYSTAFELWHAPYHSRISQWIYARLGNNLSVDYDNGVTLDISSHPAYRMTAVLTRDGGGYTENLFNADRSLNTEEKFLLNKSKLPIGNYTLSVKILSSLGGSVVEQIDEYFEKPYNGIPAVGIDENNAMRVNGQLFFPVTPWLLSNDQMVEWKQYINTLYAEGYYDGHNIATWADYLDNAQINNLYAIGPERWDGKAQTNFERNSNISNLVEYIKQDKNKPALFGWFWKDEPNLGGTISGVIAEVTASWTFVSHKYDSQHPASTQMYGYNYLPVYGDTGDEYDYLYNSNRFGKKSFVSDITGFDIYPLEYQYHYSLSDPAHGVMELYLIGIDNLITRNYKLLPTMSFIEPCDEFEEDTSNPAGCIPYNHVTNTSGTCYAQDTNRIWTPAPTPAQLKAQVWMNIVHGIKGINWFPFFEDIPPENYVAMAEFLQHINQLKNIVLGPDTTRTLSDNSNVRGNRVDTMIKENSSDIYIFAVRITEPNTEWDEVAEPVSVSTTFVVGGSNLVTPVYLFNESRQITLSGGQFTDTFDRDAVHIYRIHKS
jgi:hypothetical protein